VKLRYTDVQLSMLLGEHDAGQLCRGGFYRWEWQPLYSSPCGCAAQAMFNEPSPSACLQMDRELVRAFDATYRVAMSPEQLLALVAGVDRG
jgi:hypothetical protein